jgi:hypothetical protein
LRLEVESTGVLRLFPAAALELAFTQLATDEYLALQRIIVQWRLYFGEQERFGQAVQGSPVLQGAGARVTLRRFAGDDLLAGVVDAGALAARLAARVLHAARGDPRGRVPAAFVRARHLLGKALAVFARRRPAAAAGLAAARDVLRYGAAAIVDGWDPGASALPHTAYRHLFEVLAAAEARAEAAVANDARRAQDPWDTGD